MGFVLKQENGRLLAKIAGNTRWHLLREAKRVVEGHAFEVRHYLSPENMQAFYAFKGIAMSMYGDLSSDEAGGMDDDPESFLAFYPGKVILWIEGLAGAKAPYLFQLPTRSNGEGHLLSGSNTFEHGMLCLGEDVDPLSMQPVDALTGNEANSDLAWAGGTLGGSIKDNTFIIESWPVFMRHSLNIPQEILDDVARW